MPQMTQEERLTARVKQLCKANPLQAIHLTIIVDDKGGPLLWFVDEPAKVEALVLKMETKSDQTAP